MTALLVLAIGPASAPPAPDAIVRVEEDWELVIGTPSPVETGPQITTTMSPYGDNTNTFVAFNLNFRMNPFRAGGVEVQVWSSRTLVTRDLDKTSVLATTGETITWTQQMSVSDGQAYFHLKAGRSTTWGDFGDSPNLDVNFTVSANDLSAYSPAYSVAKSGAGWEQNRVTSMRLVAVRYYTSTDPNAQPASTDTTARSVDLSLAR
jgi:hypothetical protein